MPDTRPNRLGSFRVCLINLSFFLTVTFSQRLAYRRLALLAFAMVWAWRIVVSMYGIGPPTNRLMGIQGRILAGLVRFLRESGSRCWAIADLFRTSSAKVS